jgi:hypothetical protein
MQEVSDEEDVVVAGAPLRLSTVAVPPLLLALGAAAAALWLGPRLGAAWSSYLDLAASVAVVAAVGLATCGWFAYQTLTAVWVRRYRLSVCAALVSAGLLMPLAQPGVVLLAVAGHQLADILGERPRRVVDAATARAWRRTALWCGIVALVAVIVTPVVAHLGSLALLIGVGVAALACAGVTGFAYRTGRRTSA